MGENKPLRCVLTIGAMECIWLGAAMVLSPFYRVAPGLFRPVAASYVIPVGALCIVAGLIGFLRPDVLGGGALLLVCGVRVSQAVATRNPYPVGVWMVLLIALALSFVRFQRDRRGIVVNGRNVGDILASLDRRSVQQAEEGERQMREGERQTVEANRQTREANRQTAEGERLRNLRVREGVRQTNEGERQTVEGDRQTRESERQTIEGERLEERRADINATKEKHE